MTNQDSKPLAPRRVPEAYVRAEIASFPLTDLIAFRKSILTLDPLLDEQWFGTLNRTRSGGSNTSDLWRECENKLVEHACGWSLDRIISVRDFFWFGENDSPSLKERQRPVSMRSYLRNMASLYLETHPGFTSVKRNTEVDGFDAITHYRWMTFALPEDLLLASLDCDPPPFQVDIELPALVQRLTDTGVVEIHHHVNGGMDFPLMWASVLAALANPTLSPKAVDSPGLYFGNSTVQWLLAAAITRCILAEFLIRQSKPGGPENLTDFLHILAKKSAWRPNCRQAILKRTFLALANGEQSFLPEFSSLREFYGNLHPQIVACANYLPKTLEEVWRSCDPIASRLQLTIPNGGERWLVRHGLAYLEAIETESDPENIKDKLFAQLFWQTMRIRCLYYRTITQRPMTAGLQWFTRFYNRLGHLKKPLSAVRPEASFRVAGRGALVHSLEIRTSSPNSTPELVEELSKLTKSWFHVLQNKIRNQQEPEFGVVIHFAKERDQKGRWEHGEPPARAALSYAEPQPHQERIAGTRYSKFFSKQASAARALAGLFKSLPQALWLVRGLDVANDELAVPTWVLIPLYRFVQREAYLASTRQKIGNPPPLRLTAHVGEDFRHLMEGLRRIFECINYLHDQQGGRIGHGTALGMEPRLWAESVGSVMMTCEERLWDLVFEWRLYSGYRISPDFRAVAPPGRPEQVANRIQELAGEIFGIRRTLEPFHLAEMRHLLHRLFVKPEGFDTDVSLDAFDRARLRKKEVRFPEIVTRLLNKYRSDESVFLRGQRLVDILLDNSEVDALYSIQNALRRAVGRLGVVVEVNPSSNLLIGDLLDLRNHPILRLNSPEPLPDSPPPVPIAIGSDDPITFDTYLLREYSLLREAALAAGYNERLVHEWLARIRQIGMDSRFTVAWRPSVRKRAEQLIRDFDAFLHRPKKNPFQITDYSARPSAEY